MKSQKELRQITLEEFLAVETKMNFYNMKKGYIGFVNDKLEVFMMPCEKATSEITLEQVKEGINDYTMSDAG